MGCSPTRGDNQWVGATGVRDLLPRKSDKAEPARALSGEYLCGLRREPSLSRPYGSGYSFTQKGADGKSSDVVDTPFARGGARSQRKYRRRAIRACQGVGNQTRGDLARKTAGNRADDVHRRSALSDVDGEDNIRRPAQGRNAGRVRPTC